MEMIVKSVAEVWGWLMENLFYINLFLSVVIVFFL